MKKKAPEFRPIHYLGSKLRLLDFINETIDKIDPKKGVVCDLFSGSGVVSKHLSLTRPVISNDIQEYSRIISMGLLMKFTKFHSNDLKFIYENKIYKKLSYIFDPIIIYENEALEKLEKDEMSQMNEIVSLGSFLNYQNSGNNKLSKKFKSALNETTKRLQDADLLNSKKTMVTRYYGGLYFSFQQAVTIDALLEIKDGIKNNSKYIFHAAILSSVSDIVNTIGKQFAQPLSLTNNKGEFKLQLSKKILKDRRFDMTIIFKKWIARYNNQPVSKFSNLITKLDYAEVLKKKKHINVVYADPPYTRYHYSRYYHVLETISLRDLPEITSINKNGDKILSKGVYRNDRHQSPFGLKNESDKSFDTLFKKTSELEAKLVLSYSPYNKSSNATPRVQTIDNLVSIAKKYFKKVDVLSFGQFSHSKLNKTKLHIDASKSAEILIVCTN
jgi:adenine-specific DNA methylase